LSTAVFIEDLSLRPLCQAILDSTEEGIWGVDHEGTCAFVNRSAAHLLGFRAEELLGRNLHNLLHLHAPGAHSEIAANPATGPGGNGPETLAECPVLAVYRHDHPFHHFDTTLTRKDGSTLPVEMSGQPLRLCAEPGSRCASHAVRAITTFRLRTEPLPAAHQQQEKLRMACELAERRTAELDAVIESMPHGVFIAAQDGSLRSNHLARAMAGPAFAAQPQPGEPATAFPGQLSTLRNALAGEASEETIKTGQSWIHSIAAPILLNGEILGGVAVNTDVTQERLHEEALRRSEKLAAVGQLASSIAHEINNPLESITNLLYLIRQAKNLGEVQEYAHLAQSELSRVTAITVQTLRFHRQQTRPGMIDLSELMRSIVALYAGKLLARSIDMVQQLGSAPPVCCLEGEIRQVCNNFVRNAVDAMPRGGRLLLRVHPERASDGRNGARFTIADTGEGIAPRILAHLFEPFQTTKELTGTGLGLWVSKGIIDKHHGRIRVRTARGPRHGTVFTVWLPSDPAGLMNEIQAAETGGGAGPQGPESGPSAASRTP
jgi:signal transduction histidine kinase